MKLYTQSKMPLDGKGDDEDGDCVVLLSLLLLMVVVVVVSMMVIYTMVTLQNNKSDTLNSKLCHRNVRDPKVNMGKRDENNEENPNVPVIFLRSSLWFTYFLYTRRLVRCLMNLTATYKQGK